MVVKAAGCAGQGILILAWLETRDHFNPFALRASEDFPVDVDRPMQFPLLVGSPEWGA